MARSANLDPHKLKSGHTRRQPCPNCPKKNGKSPWTWQTLQIKSTFLAFTDYYVWFCKECNKTYNAN